MNSDDFRVMLCAGRRDGAFASSPILFGAGPGPADPAIAEFHHDGRPDLAMLGEGCSDDVPI